MNERDEAIRELVIANRILAHEGVVDAYGHVSMRSPGDPGRYLISVSRSPELVKPQDIAEFALDGNPARPDKRPFYLERFIHGAIYEARPDVQAVVHSHAYDVLPFSISTTTRLRPVIHSAGPLGHNIPIWDIADKFGDTTLLVVNMAQGRDLAQCLDGNRVVLMRGHGFAASARTVQEVVRLSIYMPKNAKILMDAMRLGDYKPLSAGEVDKRLAASHIGPEWHRAWEYWATRAGCGELVRKPAWSAARPPAKTKKAAPKRRKK